MSEQKELLKKLAAQIRDERKIGANTAQRVGSFLLSLVESGADIEELTMYFLRKDQPDETRFLLGFLAGTTYGQFSQGPFGTGACIQIDPGTGKSYMEVDKLFVRMKAIFTELVIDKLSHVGGNVILSPARMQCIKVEEYTEFYRCFFQVTDGDRTIENEFAIDDQATVREFNIKPGAHQDVANRYYWRLVVGIGEDYIDLSKTDCDDGSDIPSAGDDICQLGNRSDQTRQNALFLSSFGASSPCIQHYKGIDSYTLIGKKVTEIGEGSAFTGKVDIGKGSTGFGNLEDKPDIPAIQKAILDTLGIANEAIETANTNQEAVDNLNEYVDGAFSDGIIQGTEAKAIEKYINTVNNTKAAVEATYNKLFLNAYLEGAPKTDLLNAKVTLFGSISALISAINSAIADGKVTVSEKNNVDTKFSAFNSAYAGFNTAVEGANKSIQDKLKKYSEDAKDIAEEARSGVDQIPQSVKDTIARSMGYSDFSDLEFVASKGRTIIKDGTINTDLIKATVLITSQVIAEAIRTATLDINGNFIVGRDGKFKAVGGEMRDMILTGAFRSPFKSGKFSWGGGQISIPGLQNNNNVIIPNATRGSILGCALPCTMDYDGFCATILNEDFNEVQTEGTIALSPEPGYAVYEDGVNTLDLRLEPRTGVDIQGLSDGTAFRGWIVKRRFKTSTNTAPLYGEVLVYASPSNAGTVSGGGYKAAGTTGVLTATPKDGYAFSRWHDNVMTPSREVTWDEGAQYYTAYFVTAEVFYTITVKASPIIGGTVTGGGRKWSETTGFIKAVANSGYAFTHWQDGNTNTERLVTWDADKTYTAYFEIHTPSTGELLTNATFKDITGVGSLFFDMIGTNNYVVSSGALLWSVNNYVSGTTRAITFNKGFLAGKTAAGKKYRLTVTVAAATENIGKHLMVLIGTMADPMAGSLDIDFSPMGIGDTVLTHTLSAGYATLVLEFVTNRASTSADCVMFVSDSIGGIIYIKNPSLKEI